MKILKIIFGSMNLIIFIIELILLCKSTKEYKRNQLVFILSNIFVLVFVCFPIFFAKDLKGFLSFSILASFFSFVILINMLIIYKKMKLSELYKEKEKRFVTWK